MTSPDGASDRFSPELRASLFHFTVFASVGVVSAYFPIWLADKGISSTEIGIINAAPILIALLLNVYIGRLADRASDWRTAIIVLSALSGIASLAFFLELNFWGVLIAFALTTVPGGALVPVIDAATVRMTQRRGTDFGFIRAWGTVGYAVVAGLSGLVIGWLGPVAFVPLFVLMSLLRTGFAFPLPTFRAPPHETAAKPKSSGSLRSLLKLWFLLPCIAFACMQATHFFLGSLGALVWQQQGIAEYWIGPLIMVSAGSEALMMFLWRRVGRQMTARTMLIIAGAVATVRWIIMALNPALPLLFVLQLLHSVTYAFSYFGIVHFIANWASEEVAAEAQSFAWALAQVASVLTLVGFGWLVGQIGGQTYFAAALLSAIAAGAAWWSLKLKPAHDQGEPVADAR